LSRRAQVEEVKVAPLHSTSHLRTYLPAKSSSQTYVKLCATTTSLQCSSLFNWCATPSPTSSRQLWSVYIGSPSSSSPKVSPTWRS